MDELGATLGVLCAVAVMVVWAVMFTVERRCPRCKRWFGLKVVERTRKVERTSSGKVWDYKRGRHVHRHREWGTITTRFACRHCSETRSTTRRYSHTR